MEIPEDQMDQLALMGHLQDFFNPNFSKEFMEKLPGKIRERTDVLLADDKKISDLQKEHKAEVHRLHKEYMAAFRPIFQRRAEIVSGKGAAITDEEVKKGMPAEHHDVVEITAKPEDAANVKGVPGFWLKAFQHHVILDSMIKEYDEVILNHLIDVARTYEDTSDAYTLTFTFAPNEHFEDEKLTIKVTDDGKVERTAPKWKPGKNVTVKTITKKQRAKRTGAVRTINQEVPCESFFAIFQESAKKEDKDQDDEDEEGEEDDEEQLLPLLFIIRNSIIPMAVEYYTGEAPDGTSDVEDDEEYEEEEDEEEEDFDAHRHMPARGAAGRGAPARRETGERRKRDV
ncbi:nucleosome assembly protein 1-like 1 [Strigomonas culicis]|uniref:Nucleosome assembly protein 1-like 1 n=1 Tax=Strigomonas culicis TaxID=28005 RepID=S9WKG3_9TRYP|nr:nucleosome assembly protein 1-like 1 [Strigomonas culicis]|eukprot:EPY36480.1 nucleosome assembly protein 1-like 1 [Strigomonas culicis]